MCKRTKQQFKERLAANKGRSITGEKISPIVEIPINEYLVVSVDRGIIKANTEEIQEQVKDLFRFKLEYTKEEKIALSNITDCTFDLKYIKGTVKNNIKKAHFIVC